MPKVALTDRFVAHAKAQGVGQLDYFDETIPGLALRVSSAGRKTWTYHYTSPKDGKRARLTLGTYPATTLASARGLATEARGSVEKGTDPRTQTSGAMTVAALSTATSRSTSRLCERPPRSSAGSGRISSR